MARLLVAYAAMPAHELLRALAAEFHGVEPGRVVVGHVCPGCGGDDHGRPVLIPTSSLRSPAHVSLSRAAGMSLAAVTDAGPLGVDIEISGAAGFAGFADVALGEHDDDALDPTTAWVRKEALLKAYGLGLAVDPRDVPAEGEAVPPPPGAPRGTAWRRDLDVPGHAAAVAVLLERPADTDRLTATVSRW
ncbi:MAG: 4'-phosphopantetheinyl transferase superfamily protein [Candidatus Nanopelagicales bacterium]|jgi:4'-phosphopantetheinyl transferase